MFVTPDASRPRPARAEESGLRLDEVELLLRDVAECLELGLEHQELLHAEILGERRNHGAGHCPRRGGRSLRGVEPATQVQTGFRAVQVVWLCVCLVCVGKERRG